ncbi:MAG: class I SAM-dependent methyltransferase [Pseudomonadota bacterium]
MAADNLGLGLQLAGNAARFGWYTGVNWLLSREGRRHGSPPRYRPERPVPSQRELFADLAVLFRGDAELVRDRILPVTLEPPENLADHLDRLRAMFRDLPGTVRRRAMREVATAADQADAAALPGYFTQDFHFQTGGYLSEDSARLYDVQVETLFYGAAAAMRRAALRPIARHLTGHDQRRAALLDVACGTGRLLRDIRLAFPALNLAGLDLSRPYLAEAERHLGGLRPVTWIAANAEAIPLADASQDIVTSVFLFHELPGDVRRRVAAEMARVLKPGGLLVFVDSLQFGDRPEWDGLIEAFPHRFHEPYYRHYAVDDLDALFDAAGLAAVETSHAFLSKVMVRRKVG